MKQNVFTRIAMDRIAQIEKDLRENRYYFSFEREDDLKSLKRWQDLIDECNAIEMGEVANG